MAGSPYYVKTIYRQTNRQIAENYGLILKQIKQLIDRQNNKAKKITLGYVPQPNGHSRTNPA